MLANILIACIAGSVLSLAIAAFVAFRVESKWVPTLVSYAVGALLGAVFLDLLPHIFEASKNPGRAAAFILFGILAFFILEKLLLWRHHHHHVGEPEEEAHGHYHAHDHAHDSGRSGWTIVIGDSFHNFTDGVIIASAFLADLRLGVVTAIAIVAHEIPQEIGDFVVLLHSGFSKKKALVANALSGLAMVVGALIGYFALSAVSHWIPEIIAIAAASMIYVAVADLIPGLHKRTGIRETLVQVAFIAAGIASIWGIHAALVVDH
jgi:zinc and cadmium transporter